MGNGSNKHEKIQQLNIKYNKIQPPPQLKSNLQTILYKEQKKLPLYKIINFFSYSAAVIFVSIIILTNLNATLAKAIETIPIIGSIAKIVTFRTYQNETPNFEANVELPQISADILAPSASISGVEELNKRMEDYIQGFITEHEADVEISNGIGKKELFSTYEVLEDSNEFLSLRIDTSIIMNSTLLMSRIYHLDKIRNQSIELFDLFEKDSDYIAVITQNIREQMLSQMAEDDMITYFIGSDFEALEFKGFEQTQNFYINSQKQLVLVFDKYSVAPGTMGMVEFTIPTKLIEPLLSPLGVTWLYQSQ